MNNPQPNQVWVTKSGRLCLIVDGIYELKMLWLDELDNHWTVTQFLDRLNKLTMLTPVDFFADPYCGKVITKLAIEKAKES